MQKKNYQSNLSCNIPLIMYLTLMKKFMHFYIKKTVVANCCGVGEELLRTIHICQKKKKKKVCRHCSEAMRFLFVFIFTSVSGRSLVLDGHRLRRNQ